MTLPDPQAEYHIHGGVKFPNKPVGFDLQKPGEEPRWVGMGRFCLLCGFTQSPADVDRRLDAAMDWVATAEGVDADEVEDEWAIP